MAGNVREWALNELDGRRFVLGGAWNDSPRMFSNSDARDAFERAPGYGFRLAKYVRPVPANLTAPVRLESLGRNVRKIEPVNDGIFEVYRRQFAYDRTPLNETVEEVTELDGYRKLCVVFDAAYAGERLRAYLFLPKHVAPPYQPVVFFPPSDVFVVRSSKELSLAWGEPIVQSGRAFVYPVYKNTYERRTASPKVGANEARELRIAWSRDLGRTIDYLETRSDLDLTRLTFYAVGVGPTGVILTALEPRVKFSVLQGAGIALWGDFGPEIDAIHYAPRVRVPTLLLSARYDQNHPVEASQRPLFELLGSSSGQKQHIILEMGHGVPVAVSAREILPWLDRNLGPVRTASR
jgi:pimeloyl-ACP methyl ester carboxylesterase